MDEMYNVMFFNSFINKILLVNCCENTLSYVFVADLLLCHIFLRRHTQSHFIPYLSYS